MARFTKELRQQIVQEFATRHNGLYDPHLFLREVEEKGEEHPAHEWFEWNDAKAAGDHRLWQARVFAQDLRISFKVEEVGRTEPLAVKVVEMPAVISPMASRHDGRGGGYVLTDPANSDHRLEHCRQAAQALETWLNRYAAAIQFAGGSADAITEQIKVLRAAKAPKKRKAA